MSLANPWGICPCGHRPARALTFENPLLERFDLGDTADFRRLFTQEALEIFAIATGNHNPVHRPTLISTAMATPKLSPRAIWAQTEP